MANEFHLDVDPNDPRNVPNADQLPSLTEVPEADPNPAPVSKVRIREGNLEIIGRDPNDPRA